MKHLLIFTFLFLQTLVSLAQQNQEIFTIVEDMPMFGTTEVDLQNYINAHSKFRTSKQRTTTCSPVFVKLIIETDGKATFDGIVRGDGGKKDKAAKKVVKKMPNWKPGKQKGEVQRVAYIIPFWFEE